MIDRLKQMFGFGHSGTRGFLRTSSAYDGASRKRRLKNMRSSVGSPDGELLKDLPTLRERSRQLYKNNPIARGLIRTLTSNIVGRGLKMQSAIDRQVIADHNGWDLSSDEVKGFFNKLEATIERRFAWFAESTEVDVRGQMNFYELTNLAFNSILQSGEVFVTLPIRQHNMAPFRLRVGLIEADQVQSPLSFLTTRTMRDGIVTTPDAIPLGYWVNANQEQFPEEMKFIPKFGKKSGRPLILHLFKPDRPGQSRGVPMLSPIMGLIKKLDNYTKSELDAAEVQSFFTVFIESDNPDALANNNIVQNSGPQTAASQKEEGDDYVLGPAAMNQLQPGEKIEMVNPMRPNSNFEPFFSALLKQVGMASGVPFEILLKHITSSYTAYRGARVEFNKEINVWREWLEFSFCVPVFREFMIEEVANGRIDAPGFFDNTEMQKAYVGSTWAGEAPGLVDPVKETQSAFNRAKWNLTSFTEETAAMTGNDYASNLQIAARERELRQSLGLPEPTDSSTASVTESTSEVIEEEGFDSGDDTGATSSTAGPEDTTPDTV